MSVVSSKIITNQEKPTQMVKTQIQYCINCGFVLNEPESDLVSMCYGCTAFSSKSIDFLRTYTPAVCGDDVCFIDEQGMPNLDGETCSHARDFCDVFDNY